MLEERGIPYSYCEYRKEPLDAREIRSTLDALGVGPGVVLRRNDRAFKELGLTGDEGDELLIDLMANHPTLLQRPIGLYEGRAVVGRPPEKLLELVGLSA